MPSEIERFLFGNDVTVHFVTRFEFNQHKVVVRLRGMEPQNSPPFDARFEKAEIVSIEFGAEDEDKEFLDLIGFDCYPNKGSWHFVLNCGRIEWVWNSSWPSIDR